MQELPNELKEEYLRRATLLLENFGHTHIGHAGEFETEKLAVQLKVLLRLSALIVVHAL